MRVLAGVDGTERGDHAAAFASQLMDGSRDTLWLYFSPPSLMPFVQLVGEVKDLARSALIKSVFEKAAATLPSALQPTEDACIVGNNRPCEGILATASDIKADLIVVGAHSASRRLTLLLGGTARSIAHQSHVPVLVVRENQKEADANFRVLLLCDDKDHWESTARCLSGFSWPEGTEATLFHVVESMPEESVEQFAESAHPSIPNANSLVEEYRTSIAERRAERRRQIDEVCREKLPPIIRDAESKVSQGYVLEEVVEEVREQEIDLVVVGARRLGRIGRLLGSTTESLLSQCPCSMLIVHESPES